MKRNFGQCCLGLAVLAAALPLAAQTTSGSISGTITDATHSSINAADITATEVNQKFTLNTKSDAAGRFVFATVPPGTYQLDVRAPGFKEFTQTGIVLDANDRLALP